MLSISIHFLWVFFSSTLSEQVHDRLFLQSAKGYSLLQEVKKFMTQHILPAQKVSTQESKYDSKQIALLCMHD